MWRDSSGKKRLSTRQGSVSFIRALHEIPSFITLFTGAGKQSAQSLFGNEKEQGGAQRQSDERCGIVSRQLVGRLIDVEGQVDVQLGRRHPPRNNQQNQQPSHRFPPHPSRAYRRSRRPIQPTASPPKCVNAEAGLVRATDREIHEPHGNAHQQPQHADADQRPLTQQNARPGQQRCKVTGPKRVDGLSVDAQPEREVQAQRKRSPPLRPGSRRFAGGLPNRRLLDGGRSSAHRHVPKSQFAGFRAPRRVIFSRGVRLLINREGAIRTGDDASFSGGDSLWGRELRHAGCDCADRVLAILVLRHP